MSTRWALIKDGYVINKIIADSNFVNVTIAGTYDTAIDLTSYNGVDEPDIEQSYDPVAKTFGSTKSCTITQTIDPTLPVLATGKNPTFQTFVATDSQYTISLTADQQWVMIGCFRLSALWCRYAFNQFANGLATQVGPLSFINNKVVYGDVSISMNDMTAVLNALASVQFTATVVTPPPPPNPNPLPSQAASTAKGH